MFTRDSVCKTIKEIMAKPMNPDRIHVLADLMYISRHMEPMEMETMEKSLEDPALTKEQIVLWLNSMENADGSTGPHWTMDKTEDARKQRNIQCDPLEFYVAMNLMYSDYAKAAETVACSNMDFYVCMARAFLCDKDAQPNKLARYYQYIAAHG